MNEKNIVALFDHVTPPEGGAHPEIIERLEKFLEQARRGEIDGIAIAISRPNDTVRASYHFGSSSFRLFGAMAHLQNEMSSAMTCVSYDDED